VGHTDNEGTLDGNLRLSMARAQAVIGALTGAHSITSARLNPFGCGQYAPVASNDTPDGRAKNRRVELVKQ
jgi:outer membrane protein OmpA-like peptidoglycan-associated protein